ncbi:tetratricopeptide repeat protein [Candidatus Poribacteria bacterium]|nr:tetratricopeptide repeat protein [Candidatus Poribacteria bacterium]
MEHCEETLATLNRAIERNPDDTRGLAHRGETYRLMGRYQEALADFNRAIELNPNYAWAIAHRGDLYRQTKRAEAALADFNRAIELNSNYAWAIARRGVTYRLKGRWYLDKALSDLNRAIELKPDYAWAMVHRANVYVMMGRYEEALVDADGAIALDGTIVSHWRGERGLLLNYLGRYAEAIACCEKALQENPDDHIALYSLAVAKACWKGRSEAQAEIDKTQAVLQSLVNTEAHAGALYRLGGLAALQGKTEAALSYLQEAISLEDEPLKIARHDPAWHDQRGHPRFQSLVGETIFEKPDG